MSAPLADSFNQVISDITSEAKALRCLSNLRGAAAHSSPAMSSAVEEISALVDRLEHKFVDVEAFVDNELSCLDLLNDLLEKATQQQMTITTLSTEE
jgi:hypothetical protein